MMVRGVRCAHCSAVEVALFHGGRLHVLVQCLRQPLCRLCLATERRHVDEIRMFDGLFWRIKR